MKPYCSVTLTGLIACALLLQACDSPAPTSGPVVPGEAGVGPADSTAAAVESEPAGAAVDLGDPIAVRDRMVAAMRRPGFVYVRVAERRQDAGIFSNSGSIVHWLEADAGLAREALRVYLDVRQATEDPPAEAAGPEAPDAPATVVPEAQPGKPDRMGTAAAVLAATQEATGGGAEEDGLLRGDKIVSGPTLYDLDKSLKVSSEEPGTTCPGLSAAVSLVLGCRPGTTPTWTVEAGQYRGQKALVLVASYRVAGVEEPVQVDRYYLNPADFLPWGLSQEGTISYGTAEQSRVRADFTHDFLPADRLPEGVFDPQRAVAPTPLP